MYRNLQRPIGMHMVWRLARYIPAANFYANVTGSCRQVQNQRKPSPEACLPRQAAAYTKPTNPTVISPAKI
jgi:hypothetical protein